MGNESRYEWTMGHLKSHGHPFRLEKRTVLSRLASVLWLDKQWLDCVVVRALIGLFGKLLTKSVERWPIASQLASYIILGWLHYCQLAGSIEPLGESG